MNVTASVVSQHLAILRESRPATGERTGRTVLYRTQFTATAANPPLHDRVHARARTALRTTPAPTTPARLDGRGAPPTGSVVASRPDAGATGMNAISRENARQLPGGFSNSPRPVAAYPCS